MRILNCIYYTSNGIHCVQRRLCCDTENKFGCVTDNQGNKCAYHQNQCKLKAAILLQIHLQIMNYAKVMTICCICINQICTDADPQFYLTNEDCKGWKVVQGSYILRSSGFGCQQWPNDCNQLVNENQCQLNLQDGNMCFWTGVLQCSDASKIKYTNNIECNFWLDYCIYNPISGGCMNRLSSVDCTSSPNDSMYDTHQKCFVWNPKCTVISTFNAQGCEKKKVNFQEFIRQRNCKTNLSGQNCYWDDKQQKCNDQNNDNNCNKIIYGDLQQKIMISIISHQDCETFLSKYFVQVFHYIVIIHLNNNEQSQKINNLINGIIKIDSVKMYFVVKILLQVQIQENLTSVNQRFNLVRPGCESRPQDCGQITIKFHQSHLYKFYHLQFNSYIKQSKMLLFQFQVLNLYYLLNAKLLQIVKVMSFANYTINTVFYNKADKDVTLFKIVQLCLVTCVRVAS